MEKNRIQIERMNTDVLGVLGGITMAEKEEFRKPIKRILFRWLLPVIVFSAFIAVMCPSTKEMAAIKIIPAISRNEKAQELPGKLLGLADEWIDTLRPQKEQK